MYKIPMFALAAIAITFTTACASDIEPADEPDVIDAGDVVEEDVNDIWFAQTPDGNVLLDDSNLGFYAWEDFDGDGNPDRLVKYSRWETWSNINHAAFGLQMGGDGLGEEGDWELGESVLIDLNGLIWTKSFFQPGVSRARIAMMAAQLEACMAAEVEAGNSDPASACWWQHNEVHFSDPAYDRFTCEGYDDQGSWVTGEGVRVYSDLTIEPRGDNCGLERY